MKRDNEYVGKNAETPADWWLSSWSVKVQLKQRTDVMLESVSDLGIESLKTLKCLILWVGLQQ